MKALSVALLGVLLASCANQRITTLAYSGNFKTSIPASAFIEGAVISDEFSLKTRSGNTLSGLVITNELESLPGDFDIREYPEYLLGIKPSTDLDKGIRERFENSSNEIDHVYGLRNIEIMQNVKAKAYSLCKLNKCLAFVVKEDVADQILTIDSDGFGKDQFVQIVKGF